MCVSCLYLSAALGPFCRNNLLRRCSQSTPGRQKTFFFPPRFPSAAICRLVGVCSLLALKLSPVVASSLHTGPHFKTPGPLNDDDDERFWIWVVS